MASKLTGLFIGAGASYEVGMPLVWDLTSELKQWLTPQKLRAINNNWRSQGFGYPDEVIDALEKVLSRSEMHYESILGDLEVQFRRFSNLKLSQKYHGLYSFLVEVVYHILYMRHVDNVEYLTRHLRFLDGIAFLASKNEPLWIFSLNHDLIVECLAAQHCIPLCSGFSGPQITLPRRDNSGIKIGEIRAETITGDHLEHRGMPFLQPGSHGINLLKIHGALDVFTFQDGKDLLKLIPLEPTVNGVIETLRAANEELLYFHPEVPTRAMKVTNEIAYADDAGELQFLRRTLLAGAFKFGKGQSQVLPLRLLDYFRSEINHVSSLICIGYSFGDSHINQVIREWLEFSGERRLEIVDPRDQPIPGSLLHLSTQVTLTKSTATDFLDSTAGIVRNRRDRVEKRFSAWLRQMDPTTARDELRAFLNAHQESRVKAIAERMASLPVHDGDVDLAALGVTADEFAQQWLNASGNTAEDVLESFLANRAPPK